MDTAIVVQNLRCGGCANTINTKLSEIETISQLKVDIESSTISFEFKNSGDISLVKDKLKSLGYPSVGDKNSLAVKAMSIISCATGKIS